MRAHPFVLSPGSTMSPVLDAGSAPPLVDAAGLVFSVATARDSTAETTARPSELFAADRVAHLVAKVSGERMACKTGREVLVYGLLVSVPIPTQEMLFVDDSRQLVDANDALVTRLAGFRNGLATDTA